MQFLKICILYKNHTKIITNCSKIILYKNLVFKKVLLFFDLFFSQGSPWQGEVQLQPEQVRCHGIGTRGKPGVQVHPAEEPQLEQRHPVQLQTAAGRSQFEVFKDLLIN